MEKKYELLQDDTRQIRVNGKDIHTLYRIRALKSFTTINGILIEKGCLGGYIESERNLSQFDYCWVFDGGHTGTSRIDVPSSKMFDCLTDMVDLGFSSFVYGNAKVSHNAVVFNSFICDESTVRDEAIVYGGSIVGGHSVISDSALVYSSEVVGCTLVYEHAELHRAIIQDNAKIHGHAKIHGKGKYVVIGSDSDIAGNTSIKIKKIKELPIGINFPESK